jgi:hypothetical protein
VAVGVPLVLGLVHVALVAPHYFVGSFDDDAGYILTGRALLAGHGLTATLANDTVVAGSFPPGYSALLVPLLWLWPHTFVPLRLLSAACFAGIFPLMWLYLGRRRVGDGARVATLVLLALGPPLATYGSMVMAETPFLVGLLVLLLLVDRWDGESRVVTPTGVAVILTAGALVWLKEAGLGVVIGLVLWLLVRRRFAGWPKAAAVGVGVGLLLLPVVVARLIAGVPLAGSRYSLELGGYYRGGFADRVFHVAPHALWQMLSTALPATLVPYLSPLPIHGSDPDLWKVLSWHVTILTLVGAAAWFRRHRDVAIAIVPVYLAMTLLWPYVNERRVILVLPVLAAWYVLGAQAVWRAASSWARGRGGRRLHDWHAGPVVAVVVVAAVVVGPLGVQLSRDYLVGYGQNTSHFGGSSYAQMLSELGVPSDVVETDYVSSTALFTGHQTRGFAFTETLSSCDLSAIRFALAVDEAGYLLLGDVNKPGVLDSPCLWNAATSSPWAVQLLHTARDNASVFELIGPGTAHPQLADLTASAAETTSRGPGGATIWEWDFGRPAAVTQVSLGQAGTAGSTASVTLELRAADGNWHAIAGAHSAVGDGSGAAPYLLASLPAGTLATAVRAVIVGTGAAGTATLNPPAPVDFHALGPPASP